MAETFAWFAPGRGTRLLCGFAAAWLLTGATALQDRGTQADQDACTPDVFRLCSDMIPDEPRILTCLQGKREQLTPACGKVIGPAEKPSHRKRRAPI